MVDPQEQRPARSSLGEVFERVHKVETDLGEVKQELAGVTVSINTMATTLNQVAASLHAKASTDWKALASWATVILAVVGVFSTLALTPIKERVQGQEAELRNLQDERRRGQSQAIAEAEQRGRLLERMDAFSNRVDVIQELQRRDQQAQAAATAAAAAAKATSGDRP